VDERFALSVVSVEVPESEAQASRTGNFSRSFFFAARRAADHQVIRPCTRRSRRGGRTVQGIQHVSRPVGDFVNAVVAFALDALVISFFIVVPLRTLFERFVPPAPVLAQRTCPECLAEIPQDARRCRYCTTIFRPALRREGVAGITER
jgi:ribosomal protein L40E